MGGREGVEGRREKLKGGGWREWKEGRREGEKVEWMDDGDGDDDDSGGHGEDDDNEEGEKD